MRWRVLGRFNFSCQRFPSGLILVEFIYPRIFFFSRKIYAVVNGVDESRLDILHEAYKSNKEFKTPSDAVKHTIMHIKKSRSNAKTSRIDISAIKCFYCNRPICLEKLMKKYDVRLGMYI